MNQLKDSVGGRDTNTFVRLTDPTIEAHFKGLLTALMENDLTTAQSQMRAINALGVRYKLVRITDTGTDGPIYGFTEPVSSGDSDYRGWGAALVRPSATGHTIYQAPHMKQIVTPTCHAIMSRRS
jgi:hypothetical protein